MAVMDEAERQRFLETLRTDDDFRATVRREVLTQELLDLPRTVSTLVEHQAQMQASLTALASDLRSLTEQVEALARQQEALARQQEALARQQEALARQQAELQRAMTSLSGMVGGVLANVRERLDEVEISVAGLRTDMHNGFASVAAGFTAMGGRFDQLEAAIAELRSGS